MLEVIKIKGGEMSKKFSIALIILVGMSLMISSQVFGQQKNIAGSGEKLGAALDDNYMVTLEIETPQIKKNISFVVASTDYQFTQYFPNAQISFQGNLEVKNNNILSLDYHLGLREEIGEKDGSAKDINTEWVENGCHGGVLLHKNKPTTIFKTDDRSYTISISKIINKK